MNLSGQNFSEIAANVEQRLAETSAPVSSANPPTLEDVVRRLDRLELMMLSIAMLRLKADFVSASKAAELEQALSSETLQLGIDMYGQLPQKEDPETQFPEGAIPA